jgi:ribosomal protein S18 acetylase RimI-like enzyme
VRLDHEVDDTGTAELWPVHDAVFGDQPDLATWRATVWGRHMARDGFRLARTYDRQGLAGFAYGYTGEHGQWWTDQVARSLAPEVADAWLGGHFELVSIGVLPRARRQGLARGLMDTLTGGLPHERWLLMTSADPDDPARRLYAAQGWSVLGVGTGDDRVVMGRSRQGQTLRSSSPESTS